MIFTHLREAVEVKQQQVNTNITGDGNKMGWCNLFKLGRQAHFNWNAGMESASQQLLQLIKSRNLR